MEKEDWKPHSTEIRSLIEMLTQLNLKKSRMGYIVYLKVSWLLDQCAVSLQLHRVWAFVIQGSVHKALNSVV